MTMKPDEITMRILRLEKQIEVLHTDLKDFIETFMKRIIALEKKNGTKPVATRTK